MSCCLGQLKPPHCALLEPLHHPCSFQTRKGHRGPRETHFPPSLELLFLPHTCFCCHLACQRQEQTLGFGRVQSLGWLDGKEAFLVPCPGPGLCSVSTARFSSCSFGAHPMLRALSLRAWGWAAPLGASCRRSRESGREELEQDPVLREAQHAAAVELHVPGKGSSLRRPPQVSKRAEVQGKARGRPGGARLSLLCSTELL